MYCMTFFLPFYHNNLAYGHKLWPRPFKHHLIIFDVFTSNIFVFHSLTHGSFVYTLMDNLQIHFLPTKPEFVAWFQSDFEKLIFQNGKLLQFQQWRWKNILNPPWFGSVVWIPHVTCGNMIELGFILIVNMWKGWSYRNSMGDFYKTISRILLDFSLPWMCMHFLLDYRIPSVFSVSLIQPNFFGACWV